jgi:uncharacterized protein (DUF3820 family)
MSILTDQSIMSFGKHKGKKLIEIPDEYFVWLYDNGLQAGDLKMYIEDSVPAIKNSISKKPKERLK